MEWMIILLTGMLFGLGVYTFQMHTNRQKLIADQTILQQRVGEAERTIATLNERITRETRIAAEATAQINAKNDQHTHALTAVSLHEQTINDLKRQLAECDQVIMQLQGVLVEQEKDAIYKRALTLTLANVSYDGLLVVDKDLHIIAINDTAEMIFETGDPRPIGRSLIDVTQMPELETLVEDALRNEEDLFEEQMSIDDSNYRVKARVVRRDGHMFIGIALQDITRLVRLNRARRDMVANISHELRHPIANIRLTIDALFHEQDKPKRKDSISSLRAIARETDALMWLVQEMSDLAMIESGQAIVRMFDAPLNELVNDAVERIHEQIEMRALTVVRDIPPNLHVLCDRDLAQRVLVNLIHNAMKWSPRQGTVTVTAVGNGDEVTISVLDNGPGVPDAQVERIFERFYQVDASRSGGEGTGLGLAICRHIVQAHGGRIWAEGNGEQPGGRFRFTLLAAEHQPNENTASPA